MKPLALSIFLGFSPFHTQAAHKETSKQKYKPFNFGNNKAAFFEDFSSNNSNYHWISSKSKAENGATKYSSAWDIKEANTPYTAYENDHVLHLKERQSFFGISTRLSSPIETNNKDPLVVQFEVKNEGTIFVNDGPYPCGGAYLKLFRDPLEQEYKALGTSFEPSKLSNASPYSIMFGPDRCGGLDLVHLIIQHRDKKNGLVSEKHLMDPPQSGLPSNISTLYTLILHPNASFEIMINRKVVKRGSLLTDFVPPFYPPKTIVNQEDKTINKTKENNSVPEFIPDPAARKPAGWNDDEHPYITDPNAERPLLWNEEEDGIWVPPLILNPRCKDGCGKWTPMMIENPEFAKESAISMSAMGSKSTSGQIPNPDWYSEDQTHRIFPIVGIGLELWTVEGDLFFDNILITHDEGLAAKVAEDLWFPKHEIEVALLKSNVSIEGKDDVSQDFYDEPIKVNMMEKISNLLVEIRRNFQGNLFHFSQKFIEVIMNTQSDARKFVLSATKNPLGTMISQPYYAFFLTTFTCSMLLIVIVSLLGFRRRVMLLNMQKQSNQPSVNVPKEIKGEISNSIVQKTEKLTSSESASLGSPKLVTRTPNLRRPREASPAPAPRKTIISNQNSGSTLTSPKPTVARTFKTHTQ